VRRERLRPAAWAAALAAAVAAAFWPVLANGFVNWDDPGNIVHNPWLGRLDPAGLLWTFRTTLYGHFQPLAWLSLSLDAKVWGLDPSGFHLTSLVLHAAAAVLLFVLLRRLLGGGPDADLPAAASAALFALHPLRVESVAWATERRGQLALLFQLVSALLYARAVARDPERPDLRAPLAAYALALLSKVTAAVFPGLLVALDLGLRRRAPLKRVLTEKIPFAFAAAAALALGVRAQILSGSAAPLSVSGWADRFAIAAWTPGWSAWKTVAPLGLSPFVYVSWRAQPLLFWPVAALTLVLLAAWAWSGARGRRGAFWTGAGLLLALAPALGIFKSGAQTSADRFTLLPAAVLAVGAAFLLKRWGRRAGWAALAVALVLGGLTRAQARLWRDSVALWTRAAEAGPPNALILGNLAAALRASGREAQAEAVYARLSADAPDSPAALAVAGDGRYQAGDWKGAADLYGRALALNPDLPTVRVDYGLSLYRLGRVPEAAGEFARAARDRPDLPDAWHDLGIALARLGRYEEADRCLVKALSLDPSRADSRRARLQLAPLIRRGK
jgi:tetratricopeptide (TPR) repeat protein